MDAAADAQLVKRVRDGEADAFALLVDRHGPRLYRLGMALMRNAATAEDLVQETWLSALQALDGFESRSSFGTWVYRILFNKAVSLLRRDKRLSTWPLPDEPGDDTPGPHAFTARGHWAEPPSAWRVRSPSQVLQDQEVRVAFHAAVAELPPAQAAVVVMRDQDGMSAEEVCEVLGIQAVHQRVLLHRGRTALRQRLNHLVAGGASP